MPDWASCTAVFTEYSRSIKSLELSDVYSSVVPDCYFSRTVQNGSLWSNSICNICWCIVLVFCFTHYIYFQCINVFMFTA